MMRHKKQVSAPGSLGLQIAAIRAEPDCDVFLKGAPMRLEPMRQRTRIQIVQAGALAAIPIFFLSQPAWQGAAHEFIEIVGVCFVFVCIAGRMWSILYVGARKNRELVTTGPYSVTRNPLYLFSTIGAVGIGLMFGSVVIALALGLLACIVFIATATKEAAYLRTIFGNEYDAYAARTPVFWPKFSQYRDGQDVRFSPKTLRRTLLDGLLFLAAFPIIETVEYLQVAGYLPVLVKIF